MTALRLFQVFSVLLSLSVISGYAANAQAQQNQQSGYGQQGAAATTSYNDQTLDAYVASAKKVMSIKQEMVPQIQNTQDKARRETMLKDMQNQMLSAVQKTEGITVEEYNQLSREAQNNEQLAERIKSRFEN